MHHRTLVPSRLPVVFAGPGFRWLWAATLISSLGDWLGFVTLSLHVYAITGSATALAGLLAVEAIPALVLGPVAGVVVDRYPRQRLMIGAHLLAALVYALLPFATSLWAIYLLAFLARSASSLFVPAERALVPTLVPREHLLSANAALSAVIHLCLVFGPALAGVLVATTGVTVTFWSNALSFLLAVLCIRRIASPATASAGTAPGGAQSTGIWEGLRYIRQHPALRLVLLTTFGAAIAQAALLTIEVVYVREILGGDEIAYGILISSAGVGAVIASTNATRWARRWSLPKLFAGSLLVTGLSFFPYANIPVLWLVILVVGLQSIGWFLSNMLVDTMVQQWTPDALRGQVFGVLTAERNAGHLLIAAAVAPLVDRWGPVVVLNICGVLYILTACYALSQLRLLRETGEEMKGATT
ncbi:MAG TPA: MFS transporter [Roseiflexaceae bacterium]|nr:MFS transporter [Roseiflexaceae bacterium]